MNAATPSASAQATLADLFGNLDYPTCQDCLSVTSPAAYLVSLLDFIDNHRKDPSNPLVALRARRSDIFALQLTCENTNTALPYIDLVNETLAYYVANSQTLAGGMGGYGGYNNDGAVSSEQLIAAPRNDDNSVAGKAWSALLSALYPPPLPFDRDLALMRAYMNSLHTDLHTVMRALRPVETLDAPTLPVPGVVLYGWHEVLIERLGLSPSEYGVLTDSAAASLPALFGRAGASTPAAVLTNMSQLQEFSRQTGVSYADIVAILATQFINPNYRLLAPFQALGVTFATVQQLQTGTLSAPAFISDLPTNIDATIYGGKSATDTGAIPPWVLKNYPDLAGLLVIDVVSPPAPAPTNISDPTQMFLQHLDGTALQEIDLHKLHRFIRLWQKLGLSITATDNLLTALCDPANPSTDTNLDNAMQAALHRAGLLFEAMELAGLDTGTDLDSLLTCWGPIGTNGPDSLYARRFLNPALGAQSAIFQLDPTGQIVNPPPFSAITTTVVAAKSALCAALQLTSSEFDLLTSTGDANPPVSGLGLGYTNSTPLSLDVVTALYQHAWLAHTLKLSVLEVLALSTATGIGGTLAATPGSDLLFAKPILSPTQNVSAPLLDFMNLATKLAAAGLAPVQALYLLWNVDLSGVSAPPAQTAPSLAIALRTAFGGTDAQFAITANPSVASVKALMSLVLGAQAADFYFGLLSATFTTTVACPSTGPVPPSLVNASTDANGQPRLSYNDLTKEMSYRGWLDPTTKAALLLATTDATLLSAVNTLATSNQASVDAFIATYDTPAPGVPVLGLWNLFTTYEKTLAQQPADPSGAMTTLLAALVPALAARRKQQQALSVATGVAGVDATFGPALLLDDTVLPAANTTLEPAVSDLTAVGQAGLTAQFWQTNNRGLPADITAVTASLTYTAPPTNSVMPPNPLPAAAAPATAIAATFSGYINAAQTGNYGFAVQTNAGAAVTITIDGLDAGMTPDPSTPGLFKNTQPIALTSGTASLLSISGDGLVDTFEVTWQTTGTGWQPIPPEALYAKTLVDNLADTDLRFLKIVALANNLSLAAPEIVYLATRSELQVNGQNWTAALTVTGQPPAPTPPSRSEWTSVLEALLDYAALKSQFSPGSTHLLDALTMVVSDPTRGIPQLCNVTGWSPDSIRIVADQLQISPSLSAVTMPQLTRLRDASGVLTTCGVSATTLISATIPATGLQQFEAAVMSRYAEADWLTIATTINNQIRVQQRDAMIAYILRTSGNTILQALGITPTPNRIPTAEDLYNYFLMDVEMSTCMQTSRIRMALSSVQQFIERCLNNLEPGITPAGIDPYAEWPMRKTYRVWQAAMEVFLTPQDWMVESLRDDQSEIFRDCIGQLQRGDIDNDAAIGIFQQYLTELSGIAQLDPCAFYYQPPDSTGANETAHVIARTTTTPQTYYYRYKQVDGSWSPWADTKLQIDDKPLQIYDWDGRLFLFWLKIQPTIDSSQITKGIKPQSSGQDVVSGVADLISAGATNTKSQPAIQLCYAEYRNGAWQKTKMSDPNQPLLLKPQLSGSPGPFDRSQLNLRVFGPTSDSNDHSLYVQVNLTTFTGQYLPFNGFLLNNPHSTPLAIAGLPDFWHDPRFKNMYAPWEARWRDLTLGDYALMFQYCGFLATGFETTGLLIQGQYPITIREAQPDVFDQTVMPFFAADARNTFYVTTTQQPISFSDQSGYGLQARNRAPTAADAISIPPLLVPGVNPAALPRDLTSQLSEAARGESALAASQNLRAVFNTSSAVSFDGTTITATGSAPPSRPTAQ